MAEATLTEKDFEMRWDAERVFPFFETEDAVIMAYGHWDKAALVAQVKEYDDLCDNTLDHDVHAPSDVQHCWATIEGAVIEDWVAHFAGVTADAPGTIALSVIF